MVRGRRVRAVVACSRNDDCCSPDPKRKDNGHIVLNTPSKTQTITQFFQAVEIEDAHVPDDLLDENDICENVKTEGLCEESNDLDDGEKEKFGDIITPLSLEGGPPTPHRIELCLEEEKPNKIAVLPPPAVKKNGAAPRARRKLNNNSSNTQQVKQEKSNTNHKLTEYFPVRRSVRKTNKEVLEEKQRNLEDMLRKGVESGLKVQTFENKGRGVIADQVFHRGDFVVEYAGDLVDIAEAKRREIKYAQDQNAGCYMYYFKHKGQQYCVDATAETGKLGRLVNHSRNGNLLTRTIDVDNRPRLVLIAKDTIAIGEEVTYDYGDRSKESLKHHPWLAY